MAVFVGWVNRAERVGEVCRTYCEDCRTPTAWVIGKMTKWLRFYQSPVIPFKTDYFIFCDQCGTDFALSEGDFKHVQSLFQPGNQQANPKNLHTVNFASDSPENDFDVAAIKKLLYQHIDTEQRKDKTHAQLRWFIPKQVNSDNFTARDDTPRQ